MGLNLKADTTVLILLALLGIIFFLLITNAFQFKDKVFNTLYPKSESLAQNSEAIGGMIFNDPNFTLDHEITITGLFPNTDYFYKIVTENKNGEQFTSQVRKFKTKGA